jgi:hypothetical protein
MTYKINKTDGSLLTEIIDSTVDQVATDLTLIGKNVAGYGEFVNENLVKLLENFANTSAPNNPIAGQLWFDTAQNRLKVYDGTGFRIGSGPLVTGIPPTNLTQGDLWIDSAENQLYFFDGTDLQLAGPVYKDSQGISGLAVETIFDSNGASRVVVYLWVSQILLGIFSGNAFEFQPRQTIPGFDGVIKPGFNPGTLSGMKFHVRAASADAIANSLGQLKTADNFVASSGDVSIVSIPGGESASLRIVGPRPLILGPNQNFEVNASTSALQIDSNNSGQDYRFRIKNSGGQRDGITIRSTDERVGIFNQNPDYTLDVAGSVRAQFSFLLPRYTTGDRDARTLTSANNGELIYNTTTNKVQAYANGAWVDLH